MSPNHPEEHANGGEGGSGAHRLQDIQIRENSTVGLPLVWLLAIVITMGGAWGTIAVAFYRLSAQETLSVQLQKDFTDHAAAGHVESLDTALRIRTLEIRCANGCPPQRNPSPP